MLLQVEVMGRFANGQGREFARTYRLQYWRPAMAAWVTYADGHGKEVSTRFFSLLIRFPTFGCFGDICLTEF